MKLQKSGTGFEEISDLNVRTPFTFGSILIAIATSLVGVARKKAHHVYNHKLQSRSPVSLNFMKYFNRC